MGLIGPDATDLRGQVNDDGRLGILDGPLNGFGPSQIIIVATRNKDMLAASLLQFLHYERTEKAGPTGDHHAIVDPRTHRPSYGRHVEAVESSELPVKDL